MVGKRIGELALYRHDAGVMTKGVLSDDFGVMPEQSRWLIGGIDFAIDPVEFFPRLVPDHVKVEYGGTGVDLGDLLEAGEINALVSANIPKCTLRESPSVDRLFPDYEAVKRDYYRRTGVFPITHTRQRASRVGEIYLRGFLTAKKHMVDDYRQGITFNNMDIMVPGLSRLIGETRTLLADHWWPYSIDANRAAIDVVLRYHHEQGLTNQRLTIKDVFVPGLIDS